MRIYKNNCKQKLPNRSVYFQNGFKVVNRFSFLFVLLFAFKLCSAQSINENSIIGDWMDSKRETLVRCYKENGKFYAKVLWVENLLDRGKPLPKEEQYWINSIVMKDFEYHDREWNNGTIYQPKKDKTYSAFIRLTDINTLIVTGYIWIHLLSESETFTRVTKNK